MSFKNENTKNDKKLEITIRTNDKSDNIKNTLTRHPEVSDFSNGTEMISMTKKPKNKKKINKSKNMKKVNNSGKPKEIKSKYTKGLSKGKPKGKPKNYISSFEYEKKSFGFKKNNFIKNLPYDNIIGFLIKNILKNIKSNSLSNDEKNNLNMILNILIIFKNASGSDLSIDDLSYNDLIDFCKRNLKSYSKDDSTFKLIINSFINDKFKINSKSIDKTMSSEENFVGLNDKMRL